MGLAVRVPVHVHVACVLRLYVLRRPATARSHHGSHLDVCVVLEYLHHLYTRTRYEQLIPTSKQPARTTTTDWLHSCRTTPRAGQWVGLTVQELS